VFITGAELRKVIENQFYRKEKRAGIAGFRVNVVCEAGKPIVDMWLDSGQTISDEDQLSLVANDFLVLGGDDILTPITPTGGFTFADDTPLARDEFVRWLSQRGGVLNQQQFLSDQPSWVVPDDVSDGC